jgi:glycosyltransferase
MKMKKKNLQSVDIIICLAQYTKNILIEDYFVLPGKIKIIYNGSKDEKIILSEEKKKEMRKNYFFSEDELLILFVGRLDRIKGLDVLIHAFKIVLKTYTHARLIIAGDGEYNTFLKECDDYWSKITFTGRLNKKKLYCFYQIADIGVMPSFHEQCSYVAIEMMMFGIPLVISTSTGLSEMIQEEFDHFKVRVLESEGNVYISPKELADKMIAAINYRMYTNIMRENYIAKYTQTDMGVQYLNLLNS